MTSEAPPFYLVGAEGLRERFAGRAKAVEQVLAEQLQEERERESGNTSRLDNTEPASAYDAIQVLLEDPSIEEIWINDPHSVFVASQGISGQLELNLTSHDVRGLVERMLRHTGRRVDVSNPFVDASLPDGSRLGSSGIVAPLTNSGVYQATVFYLQKVGEGNLSEVQLDQAITPDSRRADVTLSSLWSPPVVSDFLPSMVRLSVTAHSQVFIQ